MTGLAKAHTHDPWILRYPLRAQRAEIDDLIELSHSGQDIGKTSPLVILGRSCEHLNLQYSIYYATVR